MNRFARIVRSEVAWRVALIVRRKRREYRVADDLALKLWAMCIWKEIKS